MLKLQFNLRHQDIYLVNRGEVVATDSKNYLVARFNQLTDDWETPLTAIFTDDTHKQPYAVIVGADSELEENECFVPWEVLTDECNVYVSVYCGNLHTTVTAAFKVRKSGYIDGETPPPPSPTVYDTIIQALQDLDSGKQDKLTAGTNITLGSDGTISASGGVTSYEDLDNKPTIQRRLGEKYDIEGNVSFEEDSFEIYKFPNVDDIFIHLNNPVFQTHFNGTVSFYDFNILPVGIIKTGLFELSAWNMQNIPQEFEDLDLNGFIYIFHFTNGYSSNLLRIVYYYTNNNEFKIYIQKSRTVSTQASSYYEVSKQSVWQEIGGGYTLTEQDKQDIADIVLQRLQGGD